MYQGIGNGRETSILSQSVNDKEKRRSHFAPSAILYVKCHNLRNALTYKFKSLPLLSLHINFSARILSVTAIHLRLIFDIFGRKREKIVPEVLIQMLRAYNSLSFPGSYRFSPVLHYKDLVLYAVKEINNGDHIETNSLEHAD